MRRFWHVLVLLAILAMGLAYVPDLWAVPGQVSDRQTVPSKTPRPREEKDTPTPVVIAAPTLVPATRRPSTSTFTPVPTTITAVPTASASPSATITPVPPSSTATVAPPTQTLVPVVASNTPAPVVTTSPTRVPVPAVAAPSSMGGGWLLWVIGLVLIVGGAALVFVRPKKSLGS